MRLFRKVSSVQKKIGTLNAPTLLTDEKETVRKKKKRAVAERTQPPTILNGTLG